MGAWVSIRGKVWEARWKNGGRLVTHSTGVPVKGTLRPKQAEALAQGIADVWEAVSLGEITLSEAVSRLRALRGLPGGILRKAQDMVRRIALPLGCGVAVPSVREYFQEFQGHGKEQSESNRKRAFADFLDFLADRADLRVDQISAEMCRAWVRKRLLEVKVSTVKQNISYLSCAFNRAVADDLATKNPWLHLNLRKEARAVNPEIEEDRVQREAFTMAEVRHMVHSFPQPWADLVLACVGLGGLRRGDVCCLQWASLDMNHGRYSLRTGKTGRVVQGWMPELLLERLRARRARVPEGEPFVFPEMARRYLNKATMSGISTEFVSLVRVAGMLQYSDAVRKGQRRSMAAKSFHSLRHTVVSEITARAGEEVSMLLVGHDSVQVEREHYQHQTEDSLAKCKSIMDALLSAGPGYGVPA